MTQLTLDDCLTRDAADPLREYRDRFSLREGLIYLDGNSLGAMPKTALDINERVMRKEWETDLIESWNTAGWFDLPQRLGNKVSELINGGENSCVVTDTTSLNLMKAMYSALKIMEGLDPQRNVIISEIDTFPTDLYVVEGLLKMLPRDYELKLINNPEELTGAMNDKTAVVLLSQVNYRTGWLWPMVETTGSVHAAGALVVWDLCHSAGALPIDVREAEADFAVGCTYKFLNAGPGAPAFVWANPQWHEQLDSPLTGWWAHAEPFEMESTFRSADGIRKFLTSTQPMVSLSLVEGGLDIALEVDMHLVREKSLALSSLLISLVEQELAGHGFTVITPKEEKNRGSQVSLYHQHGYEITQALIDRNVVGDYRAPGVLRLGLTPLYTSFEDIWTTVQTLKEVMETKAYENPKYELRGQVT